MASRKKNGIAHRDRDFVSEVSRASYEASPLLGHLVLWIALLFVVAALAWASFAEIDEVTRAEGSVIPSRQIQVVQNLEGGIVRELGVQAGATVQEGDVLLVIDDTRFSATLREGTQKRYALMAKAARLQAETTDAEFAMPAELEDSAPEIVAQERRLYRSRQQELESNLQVIDQQLRQRRQELVEVRARRSQLQGNYALLREELERTEPLVAEGVVSEVEVLRLRRQVNETRGDLEAARLSLPRISASITELQRRKDEVRAQFRSDAQAELTEARAELAGLREANVALEDRVERTLVRAPTTGTVKQVMVTTVGQVVQPGMDLVEIVPLEDTLLVEARVRPADIAFVRPQQPATVKLTAYDYAIYGGLDATVEHISADTIVDENDRDAESYYLIRVRTEESGFGDADNLPVIPGMTAVVDILTGKKTVLQYLLKPVLRARERALRER